MAVAKARLLEPLDAETVAVKDTAMVIGGGVAGIQSALDLADMGFKTYLVEKNPTIGGSNHSWIKHSQPWTVPCVFSHQKWWTVESTIIFNYYPTLKLKKWTDTLVTLKLKLLKTKIRR